MIYNQLCKTEDGLHILLLILNEFKQINQLLPPSPLPPKNPQKTKYFQYQLLFFHAKVLAYLLLPTIVSISYNILCQ